MIITKTTRLFINNSNFVDYIQMIIKINKPQ